MTEAEALKAIEEGRFRLVIFHLSRGAQPGFVIFETDRYETRKSAERFGVARYCKRSIVKIQMLKAGMGRGAAIRRFREGAIIPLRKEGQINRQAQRALKEQKRKEHKQEREQKKAAKWLEDWSRLQCFIRSTADQGGIETLAKEWSPQSKAALLSEIRELKAILSEWENSL